jgi:hypothetical protein
VPRGRCQGQRRLLPCSVRHSPLRLAQPLVQPARPVTSSQLLPGTTDFKHRRQCAHPEVGRIVQQPWRQIGRRACRRACLHSAPLTSKPTWSPINFADWSVHFYSARCPAGLIRSRARRNSGARQTKPRRPVSCCSCPIGHSVDISDLDTKYEKSHQERPSVTCTPRNGRGPPACTCLQRLDLLKHPDRRDLLQIRPLARGISNGRVSSAPKVDSSPNATLREASQAPTI